MFLLCCYWNYTLDFNLFVYPGQSNLWDPCLVTLVHSIYIDQKHSYYVGVILDMVTELGSSSVMTSVILIRQSRPTPTESNPRYFSNSLLPQRRDTVNLNSWTCTIQNALMHYLECINTKFLILYFQIPLTILKKSRICYYIQFT